MSLEPTDRLFLFSDVFAMFDCSFLFGGTFQFLVCISNVKVVGFQQRYFNLINQENKVKTWQIEKTIFVILTSNDNLVTKPEIFEKKCNPAKLYSIPNITPDKLVCATCIHLSAHSQSLCPGAVFSNFWCWVQICQKHNVPMSGGEGGCCDCVRHLMIF